MKKLWACDAIKLLIIYAVTTLCATRLVILSGNSDNVSALYILAVVITSRITTGYLWGIAASVIGVLSINYFFIYPYGVISYPSGYPVTFFSMLLIALITSAMVIHNKTQINRAQIREMQTKKLYAFNQKLLMTRGFEPIIDLTLRSLTEFTQRCIVYFPSGKADGMLGAANNDQKTILASTPEQAAVSWVFEHKEQAGIGTETYSGTIGCYLPVMAQGHVRGVLGILCEDHTPPDTDVITMIELMLSQVAMALERQRLSDEQRQLAVKAEKEKMRSNLLRAISHDLRTPLTSIQGASAAILENKSALDEATHDKLVGDIYEEAQWLIRMVENLLSITRFKKNCGSAVTKSPEAVEEVVAESISRIKRRFPKIRIHAQVPEEFIMIPMDATLIEQVLINLMENAVKHGGKSVAIHVTVTAKESYVDFDVKNDGVTIPAKDLPTLFSGYQVNSSGSSDGARNMGIGLSICKSIITAHGGTIEVKSSADSGTVFTFRLPR